MATEVDICNLALSKLGDEANLHSIDPPDGSTQADHCARWYPIARDKALQCFPWSFATRRVEPAKLMESTADGLNAFDLPAKCLRVLSVQDKCFVETGFDHPWIRDRFPGMEWRTETLKNRSVIACRSESIIVRYIWQQTDTSTFSPLFVDALVYLLASDLAGPLHTGSTGMQLSSQMYQGYLVALQRAQTADIQEHEVVRIKPRMQGDYYG